MSEQVWLASGVGLLPVVKEPFQAFISERMLEHLINDFGGNGRHMGTGQRGLNHVQRMADGRSQHLCLVIIILVDLHDFFDKLHAVLADVVEAPNEWRTIRRSSFSDQK